MSHVTFMVTPVMQAFLAQKKNEPNCDRIFLGIKVYISNTLIV